MNQEQEKYFQEVLLLDPRLRILADLLTPERLPHIASTRLLDCQDYFLKLKAQILFGPSREKESVLSKHQYDSIVSYILERSQMLLEQGFIGLVLVDRAKEFAREKHKDHTRRNSDQPFFSAHLWPVVQLVLNNGGNRLALSLAWIHDTVEDVGVTWDEIAAISPYLVAPLKSLTEEGDTWEDRKASYKDKVPTMIEMALRVSLCDKVSNGLVFCREFRNGIFGEHPAGVVQFYKDLLVLYRDRAATLGVENERHMLYLLGEMNTIVSYLDECYKKIISTL